MKTVIHATTVDEEEDIPFDISLGKKNGEEGSSVASEVFEERLPSLLDLKLESEEAGNTTEIAVVPSAPAKPKANVPTLHSLGEEPAEPTVSLIEVRSDDSLETHY